MADIQNINMRTGDIIVELRISNEEYELLKLKNRNLLLVPTDSEVLNIALTTGKLGNSNRIMLPKRVLEEHRIAHLRKKVPAKVFEVDGDKYLVIQLVKSKVGIPEFEE